MLTSVPAMMEWELAGPALPRVRTLRFRALSLGGFFAAWAAAAGVVEMTGLFNPIFLPGPWWVAGSLLALAAKGELWIHVRATLERVALGFSTGAMLALALGLPAGYVRAVRNVVEPVVELLRPIPPLAMLPLFIVWVGIGEPSKVGFITYATFFPMFLTTVHAVRQIDPVLVRAAQTLGARPRHLFFRVILPAALPEILTGIAPPDGEAVRVVVHEDAVCEWPAAGHAPGRGQRDHGSGRGRFARRGTSGRRRRHAPSSFRAGIRCRRNRVHAATSAAAVRTSPSLRRGRKHGEVARLP